MVESIHSQSSLRKLMASGWSVFLVVCGVFVVYVVFFLLCVFFVVVCGVI